MEIPDDWWTNHDGQSIILDPDKVVAEIERLRAKIREAYTAGYWQWCGPTNEAELNDAFKGEELGWADWSSSQYLP